MKFEKKYAFLIWLFGTLLAIAFIGDNVYLGLGIALATGIVFGIVNYLAFTGNKEIASNSERQRTDDE